MKSLLLKPFMYFLVVSIMLTGFTAKGQTAGGASGMVFRFTKQVWLNPTIILAKQNFEQSTNVKLLILPRINGNDTTGSSRIEKAFDKLLSFLVYKENVQGSIKFYFNPKNPTKPFTFNISDELFCKFTPIQKDSVEDILNRDIINSTNLSNFTALPFDSIINRASRYCKKILLSKPGACGENPGNEFTLTKINSTPAKLNFERAAPVTNAPNGGVDKQKYAELEQYYNTVLDVADNTNYPIAWKAMAANTNDNIKIKLKKKESYFDMSKLVFKNANGTETYNVTYNHIQSDSTIDLSISGKSPGSSSEIVAYYTPTTTPTQTFAIGAFNVQYYEPKTYKVVLVNLGNATIPNENAVRDTLNKIYATAFINWQVSAITCALPSSFNKNIHVESSGLLSNYMPDMQPIISNFKDNCSIYDGSAEDTYYLLFGATNDGDLDGYMPRARNTGFIFSSSIRSIAHELGHGTFNLQHIFCSEELGEGNKGTTNNLMDYSAGHYLYKHQWDLIHDPSFVSWFEGDDDEGAVEKDKNYYTPAGLPFHCTETATTLLSTDAIMNGSRLNGVVYSFMTGGITYEAKITGNKFYGYVKQGTNTPYTDATNFAAQQKINVISYNYIGNCQIQKYEQSYTCPQAITAGIYTNGIDILTTFNASEGAPVGDPMVITTCTADAGGNGLNAVVNFITKNYDHPSVALVPINFTNVSCNTFALANGDIASFTSSQQSLITKIGLADDGELIAFETNANKIYYSAYGVKLTNGVIEKKYGTTYFTCFDCLEADNNSPGVNTIIRTESTGKIFYQNLLDNSSYYIQIDDSKIEPLDPTKEVMSVNNGTLSCAPASVTKEYLENGIWNCSMTSACLYKYLRYLNKDVLKAFNASTRARVLDFLFTNSRVEHPSGSDPYGWLDYKNNSNNYILMELIEAMKESGQEMQWFVDSYLLSRTGSQPINLENLINGNSNVEMRILTMNNISNYIIASGKTYNSPTTPVDVPQQGPMQIPNNLNGLVIYYENMAQTYNEVSITTSKNQVKITADEFDYLFSGANIRITQEGFFQFYKKTGSQTPENLMFTTAYNDDYLIHPYSTVPVTFGKAFNDLQIAAGARTNMPACMAVLFAELGKEKASGQNFMIVGGVVAVAGAVFTGGASLAVMGAGGVTFGGIVTVGVSVSSAIANGWDTYNTMNEGETTLSPDDYQLYLKVKKASGYLSMVEGGLGVLSMAKGAFAEMRAFQTLTSSMNSVVNFITPYVSSLFKCLQIRKIANITTMALMLNTSSVNALLLKSTQISNVAQELAVLETASSLKAGPGLNTFMLQTSAELETAVSGGSMYKISNVSIKNFKLGTSTIDNITSTSTVLDDAFAGTGISGSAYIGQIQGYNVIFQVSNNIVRQAIAYDNLGHSYKPDDGGGNNCSTCTAYSNNSICQQFTTLSNNVGATEQGLIPKLCHKTGLPAVPALKTTNVTTVLNYFNAPSPNATTIRRKWNYDLGQGSTASYLGENIYEIDGDLINAWNLMDAARSPGATSNSGFRYDYLGLKELKNLLANQTAATNLGGAAEIQLILERNERLGCNTCTNTQATYLNKMDEYLKDVTYFAVNFNNNSNAGADQVMNAGGIKSKQKWHVEGAAFMLRVIREMGLGTNDITSFEYKYADNDEAISPNEREVDILLSQGKLIECKSWSSSGSSFQKFILRQGSSYGQFEEYLKNITTLNGIEYWFDGRKATITQVKQKFQAVFRILDADGVPFVYKLKPSLFNIGGILNATDFISVVNSTNTNHPIYDFIKIK